MADVDTADALLFDDDVDDCDVGQDEEAELLREDDDDEVHIDYQVDPLEEEEEEDSHRDKFASERVQHHITVNENNHQMYNRENNYQRFNNRGHGRGRGRGGYNNGPGRKGDGKCFVNPSFLQGVKKPVQSVQPWLNQPRNYEPERRVSSAPFGGHRFQQQQHQNQCQPQYNQQMQMNNQSYGPPMNQHSWHAPQQPSHPPVQQNYYETPASQQQCYQAPNLQNPQTPTQYPPQQQYTNQSNQFAYEGLQNQNLYSHQGNAQSHYNNDAHFNQYQAPQAQCQPPHALQQQNMQPAPLFVPNQGQQHNAHMPQQSTQQAPHYMQHSQQMQENTGYFEQFPQQNQNINQNHTPAHSNESNLGPGPGPGPASTYNPPQAPLRHSGPLLQRPPMHFTHDGGHYHPRPRFQHQHPRQPFTPPRLNYQHQNTQFRPRMQTRPNFRHQFGQSQRGSYDSGHYFNPRFNNTFKRRNDWQDQTEQEYPKRHSWTKYNEQEEDTHEDTEEYNEEVEQAHEGQMSTIKDPSPDVDEDEETKAYRLKIAEQKRKREEYLAEKERKRKLEIMKKTGEVCEIPALLATPPTPASRPRIIAARLTSSTNPNLRVLTRNDSEKIELMSGTVTKVKIQPGVSPKSGDDKLTSGFLSSRKVIAQDESLLDTKVVVVSNLANSSEPQLRKMCHGVGLVQSLEMSPKERQAKIRFKSVASAHAFYKKYQRHMLDLSMIQVELVPDIITEK